MMSGLPEEPAFLRWRQNTGSDWDVLLVLTRGRDLSHSANAVSARNRKFFLPRHLAPSFGVTPFEFLGKLYGSRN